MKKRVADILFESLYHEGIDTCFCVVGGCAMHLDNALLRCVEMKKIFNHHEQACSMAAEGYARYSGKMAAVCVTSGPGATNTINGVQGAWVDSIPMIVISGFPRWETSAICSGLNIRCRGVQENDIISMVKGITKYAVRILDPLCIKREIEKSVRIAMSGRRGPVWIEVPLDIQGKIIDTDDLYISEDMMDDYMKPSKMDIDYLIEKLNESKRPCILTGSGIRSGNCVDKFLDFMERFDMPVVGGYLQADICVDGKKNYYGGSGAVGSRGANLILQNADFILAIGNSLSYDQTGFNQEAFAPRALIIMVDAEEDEAKKDGLSVDYIIKSDLSFFFDFTKSIEFSCMNNNWKDYCDSVYREYSVYELFDKSFVLMDKDSMVPNMYFWKSILSLCDEDAIFALGNSGCVCGGLFIGAQKKNQRLLVNYKCGSMGHDLPNAIGAAVASGRQVICVTGDGSFMMNIQELQTIWQYDLPIKIVLFSNGGYNAIRNTCKKYFKGEYAGCDKITGVSFPEFASVATVFGFEYRRCDCISKMEECLEWLISNSDRCFLEIDELIDEIGPPCVSSIMDDSGEFFTPPLHVMSPALKDDELRRWMID